MEAGVADTDYSILGMSGYDDAGTSMGGQSEVDKVLVEIEL